MKRARFVDPARQELLAQVAYYSEIQRELALRFNVAVEEAAARALAFPEAGSPYLLNTRRVWVRGFKFSLVYRAEDDGIVIFALAHDAQAPDYWRFRVNLAEQDEEADDLL